MAEILNFIDSEEYNKLIESVLDKVVIDINNDVPEVLLNYDKGRIDKANITTDTLISFLRSEQSERLSNFITEVLLRDSSNDIDEEYPKGQEPEDYDKPVLKSTLPYYKSFAITMLLEYYILKNNPNALEKFIKSIRIPDAKKFTKQLHKIYSGSK